METLDKLLKGTTQRQARLQMLSLSLTNIADAVEVVSIGYIISAIGRERGGFPVTQLEKELLGSSVIVGLLLGGLVMGGVSDRIGRKRSIQMSLLATSLSSIFASMSPNIGFLILWKMLGGMGVGGVLPVIFTLGAELFPSDRRDSSLAQVGFNWVFGSLYASVLAWLFFEGPEWSGRWRAYILCCSLPSMLALASTSFLVESPGYHLEKKSTHCAAESLSSLLERSVLPESLSHLEVVKEADESYKVLFTQDNVRIFTVLALIWFAQHFSSFGMINWISSLFIDIGIDSPYLNSIIFALAIVPGNLFSIHFIDFVGRKRMLLYGMVLSSLSIVGLAGASRSAVIVVLSSSLYNLFLVVSWNGLCCMSADGYFDTHVKSSAMGLLSACGRLGGIVAQVWRICGMLTDVTTLVCLWLPGEQCPLISFHHKSYIAWRRSLHVSPTCRAFGVQSHWRRGCYSRAQ